MPTLNTCLWHQSLCSIHLRRPYVHLKPVTPQNIAGTRMLPPTSLPNPSGDPPQPSIAASPPEEPPAVRLSSYGVVVWPNIGLFVSVLWKIVDLLKVKSTGAFLANVCLRHYVMTWKPFPNYLWGERSIPQTNGQQCWIFIFSSLLDWKGCWKKIEIPVNRDALKLMYCNKLVDLLVKTREVIFSRNMYGMKQTYASQK